MKTLVVEKDGKLRIQEIQKPKYNDNQALVKMIACGICNGTDTKIIHGDFKGVETSDYPLMLGHEGVGRVVEVGKNVKSFQVGDVVLLPFVDPDEENYGTLGSAWGAYSEYGVVCDPKAFWEQVPECAYAQTVVPKDIDPVDAAMIITLREVYSAVKYFGISAGESVAVYGCGPVGLTFVKFLKLLGAGSVIAIDRHEHKLQDALSKGADVILHAKECDVKEEIRKVCPEGVQYVIDAIGNSEVINQALELLCDRGKICCYGISANCNMQIDWSKASYNWNLVFQQFPSKAEEGTVNEEIIAWIRDGVIDLKEYISDYVPFEQIIEGFEKLSQKKISKKAVVVYREQP